MLNTEHIKQPLDKAYYPREARFSAARQQQRFANRPCFGPFSMMKSCLNSLFIVLYENRISVRCSIVRVAAEIKLFLMTPSRLRDKTQNQRSSILLYVYSNEGMDSLSGREE